MLRSARELSDLIGAVYEAGLDPSGARWPAVVERIAPAIGSAQSVLWLARRRLSYGRAYLHPADADSEGLYRTHYGRLDRWIEPRLPSARPGEILFSDTLVSERELLRTEFGADWLRPRGWGGGLATVLLRCGSAESVLYAARASGHGPFTPEDVEVLELLLPHVTAAVRASVRLAELGESAGAACAALDQCTGALLLVDAAAHVCFANVAAEALLRTADGLAVEREVGEGCGRLRAATPTATAALRRAIADAAAVAPRPERAKGEPDVPPHPMALALDRPSGRPRLAALAVPLGGARATSSGTLASAGAGATVAVFISDPAAAAAGAAASIGDRLRAVYRLTPAESAVAIALAEGNGLAVVAARQRVTLATVRTQAQHVYRKLGVRGQASLARLVERLSHAK